MAVFTPVSRDALERWLQGYELGGLIAFEGIASGIENTNFFVDTDRGRFVLTLFERLPAADLPFYLGLMHHLADHRIPCPDPVFGRDGALFSELCGKPAALVTRLAGHSIDTPTAAHCGLIGELLARMHLAAADYPGTMRNARGPHWWSANADTLASELDIESASLLRDELAHQLRFEASEIAARLPSSAVHADLFRDNVLFEGDRIGGVIDFYFAATDRWVFDLAVTCNDWCIDQDTGSVDSMRLNSLLRAYRGVRDFSDAEREAWPTMLRAAAFRFWMSRLYDLHLPRPAQMITPKDPAHFERILRARRRAVPELG